MKHFELNIRADKIGILYFDLQNEKVNKFNREVMAEFEALIKTLKSRGAERTPSGEPVIEALIMFSKKPNNFIAGADINLIQSAKTAEAATELARAGQNLINHWEDLPFPRIMAINGSCMGGGCELSLASTAIVLSDDPSARIGLPETLLGIIPGMGGCVRMPWKVGIATALELILAGKTLTGPKAEKAGLADACLPKENFEENVIQWVQKNLDRMKRGERIAREPKLGGMGGVAGKALESPLMRGIVFKKARTGVMAKTKGQYPAPLKAIEVIQEIGTHYQGRLYGLERDEALITEAEGFGKMAATDVSKNCIKLFFLTEGVKKATGLPGNAQVPTKKIQTAAVLGAGVMGGGISQLLADKGVEVRMKDIQNSALELGVHSAMVLFKKAYKKRIITERQMQQRLNRIAPTTDFAGFKTEEFVIEAVVEKMEIKQSVLKELENYISDDCVVATNTSSLSVSKMQSAMKNPSRFAGMHFFNPVHKMPLVEVIRGEKSSDFAVSQAFQFSKQIGKYPIVVKDSPGFLVNRLLGPYLIEAAHMMKEGVRIEEMDPALLKFGMPMGPAELIDEVGLDIGDKVSHILNEGFGERMKPVNTFEKLLELKRFGKKSGTGFYVYSGKDKSEKKLDPQVYSIMGVQPKANLIPAEEIVDRGVLQMVNEAARCLEEKVVASPDDVDLGMVMGTGFPPFRGGLLKYADDRGLNEIIERLKELQGKYGMRFEPSQALLDYARRGGFYPKA
ncbi:MAG: enoyl-CoA hydratase/isomerase family protein [Bdellovibrionales bacterium]|nr:enoyl-CoA hydratase/isomerase family protein [Bdellovibrionales bacterium]